METAVLLGLPGVNWEKYHPRVEMSVKGAVNPWVTYGDDVHLHLPLFYFLSLMSRLILL